MSAFKHNTNIVVDFVNPKEPPYRMHGKFQSEDDEYITIIGTVGDFINKTVLIPKRQIKMIEVLG